MFSHLRPRGHNRLNVFFFTFFTLAFLRWTFSSGLCFLFLAPVFFSGLFSSHIPFSLSPPFGWSPGGFRPLPFFCPNVLLYLLSVTVLRWAGGPTPWASNRGTSVTPKFVVFVLFLGLLFVGRRSNVSPRSRVNQRSCPTIFVVPFLSLFQRTRAFTMCPPPPKPPGQFKPPCCFLLLFISVLLEGWFFRPLVSCTVWGSCVSFPPPKKTPLPTSKGPGRG